MRRSQSPLRRLRACVACAKARAQCRFQASNVNRHLCDRCQRLGRRCEAQPGEALRRPRRVMNREDEDVNATGNATSSGNNVSLRGRPNDEGLPSSGSHSTSTSPSSLLNDLTAAQTIHILHIFRTKYQPNFPFISVREEMSVTDLCEQRPTVFRCIMLVAAPLPVNKMEAIKNEVLGYVGSKVLVENTRNLDMLQGMLICIAWATLNSACDERITTLTYLALGLAHTLGITKIPIPLLQKVNKDKKAAQDLRKGGKGDTHGMRLHSLEEQRAFLGLYYVLSINSVHFGRKNPLDGAYVQHCLDTIISAKECPTDAILVYLLEFTQISERIPSPNLSERDVEAYASLVEGTHRHRRAELDRLRESVADERLIVGCPTDIMDEFGRKPLFEMEYQVLIARLNEPATHLSDIVALGGTASAHRSVWLQSCLKAVVSYFEMVLSMSPETLLYQSLAFPQQATFMLIMATRLSVSTAGAPDWDVNKVKAELNMSGLVKRLVNKMMEVDELERRNVRTFLGQHSIEAQEWECEEKGYWGIMGEKMGNVGDWFERMAKRNTVGIENGPEVDELLARVAGTGMGTGQDSSRGGRDGTAWLGLLPMGNFGWRFDDI